MTKQEFVEIYGKTVYQVRLESVIANLTRGGYTPRDALIIADELIKTLLEEDKLELKNMF